MKLQLSYASRPHGLFAPLLLQTQAVLLHSADTSNRFGRYDIMSADPVRSLCWTEGQMQVGTEQFATNKPLDSLGEQHRLFCANLPQRDQAKAEDPPFSAGFIGYFAYPLHQTLERQQPLPTDLAAVPPLRGGFYDWSIVTDHVQKTTHLYTLNQARQHQVLAWLDAKPRPSKGASPSPLQPSSPTSSYRRAFERIQAYLAAGDCYQVNLAQHFSGAFQGDPWMLYQQWCEQQAAPFNAYLDLGSHQGRPQVLLSLSPERFLEIDQQLARVCPIKGTTARGASLVQDEALAMQLQASAKDQAENLMIVDLLRNDLGRICETGSVQVTNLFELLKFSNVQHLVSTIVGRLADNTTPMQAFASLFPSGSITGAPKIRAIDIINELEPVGRSVYCGSIGYWDQSGRLDSSVAIRTGLVTEGRVHLWGGGGIVTDSDCDAELQEIHQKIGRLLNPVQPKAT